LFPTPVEVGGGRVGYCLSHNECNRFRVGVRDWGERLLVRQFKLLDGMPQNFNDT